MVAGGSQTWKQWACFFIVMARDKRLKILKHIGILENIGIKSSLNIGMYENKGSPDHPCDFSSTKLESWFMPEV